MKKIFKFIFAFVFSVILWVLAFYSCQAQISGTFKAVRFVNSDSSDIISDGLGRFDGSGGIIYYNEEQNKFRAYQDSTWIDLISSGGGGAFWPLFGTGVVEPGTNVIDFTANNSNLIMKLASQSFPPNRMRFKASPGSIFIGDSLTNAGLGISGSQFVGVNHPDGVLQLTNSGVVLQSIGAFNNINLNSAEDIVVTTSGAGAMRYAADYSANYTNRSLVDKEYVDNTAGGGGSFWPLSGDFTTNSPQEIRIPGEINLISANSTGTNRGDLNLSAPFFNTNVSIYSNDSLNMRVGSSGSDGEINIFRGGVFIESLGGSDSITLKTSSGSGKIVLNSGLGRINLDNSNGTGLFLDGNQINIASGKNFVNNGTYTQTTNPDFILGVYSGSLTDGAPTNAEINAIVSSPQDGERATIKDTNGTGNIYNCVYWGSTATWYYTEMSAAP